MSNAQFLRSMFRLVGVAVVGAFFIVGVTVAINSLDSWWPLVACGFAAVMGADYAQALEGNRDA